MFDTEKFVTEIEGTNTIRDIANSDYQNTKKKKKKLKTGEMNVKLCATIGNYCVQKEEHSLLVKRGFICRI
jgi:hypothetical protein